LVRLILKA